MRFALVAALALAFPLAAAGKARPTHGFDLAVQVKGGTLAYTTGKQFSPEYTVTGGGVFVFDNGPKKSVQTTATFVLTYSNSQIKKVAIFAPGRGCTSKNGGTVMTCEVLPLDIGTLAEYGIAYRVGHNTHLQGTITIHATVKCVAGDLSCRNNTASGTLSLRPKT
ncbi:MAG: hypothetical protein JOY72_11445 [Actinobacteria bacterium]|nr:hypothetical protein [Actinomycetota bacterium]